MSNLKSSFYKDNSPNYDEFKAIDGIFEGLEQAFESVISQALDNSNIVTMRTYSIMPLQIINVADACYSLPTILSNQDVLMQIGISPTEAMSDRMKKWELLSIDLKIQALDFLGLSVLLVNPDGMKDKVTYSDSFSVVDFEIYDNFSGEKLMHGTDYYYSSNKIYFLKFATDSNYYREKKVTLKNIAIDKNSPEKMLGEAVNIYSNNNFAKTEYRDVVTSFAGAALGGPTVSNIMKSFNPNESPAAAGFNQQIRRENALSGVSVVDFKSADNTKKRFWETATGGFSKLTPFDFIVSVPTEFLYRTEKMQYVQEFMLQIKPAHTKFIFVPEVTIKEQLLLKYKVSLAKYFVSREYVEKIKKKDNLSAFIEKPLKDGMFFFAKSASHDNDDVFDNALWGTPLHLDGGLTPENAYKTPASDKVIVMGVVGAVDSMTNRLISATKKLLKEGVKSIKDNVPHTEKISKYSKSAVSDQMIFARATGLAGFDEEDEFDNATDPLIADGGFTDMPKGVNISSDRISMSLIPPRKSFSDSLTSKLAIASKQLALIVFIGNDNKIKDILKRGKEILSKYGNKGVLDKMVFKHDVATFDSDDDNDAVPRSMNMDNDSEGYQTGTDKIKLTRIPPYLRLVDALNKSIYKEKHRIGASLVVLNDGNAYDTIKLRRERNVQYGKKAITETIKQEEQKATFDQGDYMDLEISPLCMDGKSGLDGTIGDKIQMVLIPKN